MKIHTYCLMLVVAFVPMTINSCVHVAPYQKQYLSQYEMQLGDKKIEQTELNFQSYREGASGVNGGKTGGGCGCN